MPDDALEEKMGDADGRPIDRPRGVLAPVDRAFLLGEKDYDHRQSRYDRRRTIRERVRNALIDFTILFQHMDVDERERVFTPPREESREFREGLMNLLGFVYGETFTTTTIPKFDHLLEVGVRRATWQLAGSDAFDVEVDFDVRRRRRDDIEWGEVEEKVVNEEWDRLTEAELRAFIEEYSASDDFDPTEPRRQWNQRYEEAMEEKDEAVNNYIEAAREKQIRPNPESGHGSNGTDEE